MTQKTIKSVRRIFEILELFDKERRPLAAKEISKVLGYPLVSTHELLKSMNELGYADFDQPTWTYIPSRSFISVLDWVPDLLDREKNLLDFVEEANRVTRETVNISRQVNTQVRIIHGLESIHTVGVSVRVGAMMPVVGSLTGLTMLAAMTPEQRKDFGARLESDKSASASELQAGLVSEVASELQECGMSTRVDIFIEGVGAVCFPVHTQDKHEKLVVGIVGPSDRIKANAQDYRASIAELTANYGIDTVFPMKPRS